MNENNNKNRRSPAVDLEALSKAYEQSLNNVTLGGRDIPTPAVRKKPAAEKRELKNFVPQDYRPRTEATPEHDKIVDKIKADRLKRSHSVWTDTPVLKPKKSVWIDDSVDDSTPLRPIPPAPKKVGGAPVLNYTAHAGQPARTAYTQQIPAQNVQQPTVKKQLPPDFIAPLPVMTRPPEPEPIPDFGALVDDAVREKKREQVVPLLNEKPRKQELLMNVGNDGDTRVKEIPHRVNKQKVTVDMSGYREEQENSATKRTVALKMPLNKMKLDDLQPEKKPEKKPEIPSAKAEDKPAEAKPEKVEESPKRTEKTLDGNTRVFIVNDEKAEENAPKIKEVTDEIPVVFEKEEEKAEAAVKSVTSEEVPEKSAHEEPKPTAEGEYNFSEMFKKVQADKKGKVREEYENSDEHTHTIITQKAEMKREQVKPAAKPVQHDTSTAATAKTAARPARKAPRRRKNLDHELEFQFINCIMCLGVVFVVFFSLLFMERESGFINSENRNLTEFPKFSLKSYFSGKYTKAIDDYFTDTIPGREDLKKFSAEYDRLKGIDLGGAKVSGKHKTVEKETLDEEKMAAVTTVTANTDPKATTTTEKADSKPDIITTTKKEEVVKLPEILDDGAMEGDVIVFGKGDEVRAVAGYYGQFETGALYAKTINKYKEALPNVNVYNMSIPTSAAFYMPNNFKDSVADQKDNIDNIAAELKGIINVDAYSAIGAHTDEYIYSRTDHHWQPLGAYYAGKAFADKAGVDYPALKTYEKCQIEGFLGTMYAYSNYDSELEAHPDTFIYYKPDNQYKTIYYNTDFTNGQEGLLFFDFAEGVNCYSAIMGKDEEITEIDTDVKNGRTLVIFKDSYGNALVPFFTHSFEKIYVCDFRYFDENAIEFCEAVGCTDLLFSISLTSCSTEMHITAINNNRIQDSASPLTTQTEESSQQEESTESKPEEAITATESKADGQAEETSTAEPTAES